MKKLLAFSVSIAALLAALSWPGNADPAHRANASADGVSPHDVLANLRTAGLAPLGQPVRRGDFYVMHAIDPSGIEVRVVTDTLFGDILSVTAARPVVPVYAARYDSGPRIIHIPDRRALRSRAMQSDNTDLYVDDDDAPVAALPNKRGTPPAVKRRESSLSRERGASASQRREAAIAPAPRIEPVPPVEPKRSVLNVPPPPPADALSPIKPTPRWRAAEKFATPSPEVASPPAAAVQAADASANEPVAQAIEPANDDTPPDGPTLDPRQIPLPTR